MAGKPRLEFREDESSIVLALDVPSLAEALSLVRATREFAGMYKVGMELFYPWESRV